MMNIRKHLESIVFKVKRIMPESLVYLLRKARLTKRSRKDHNLICAHMESVKDFKKALYQCSCLVSGRVETYINAYLNKSVKSVKVLQPCLNENDPILICLVKDDLERIKLQLEHHRKIGIKYFAYIDNMSKDGTFEWLKKQDDVSLFIVNERYGDIKQRAWMRQVIDILGYDRWYLALDSDELFMYPGIETKNINRYIDFLENNKIKSTFSPMIDMYSKGRLFEDDNYANGILNTYCYFDTNTYKKVKKISRYHVTGGPRWRLFSTETCLSKYALTKFSKDMMDNVHENCPSGYNFETNGAIAFLLHYKFLPDDNKKYKEHVLSEVHTGGSKEYKTYMTNFEQSNNMSFYYEKSQKLNNSMDLMKIDIIDKIFFKKFLTKNV